MEGKKFLVAAITCAMLTLGIGGTSSAAEISSDFSTLQVENQELSWGRPGPRHQPPPPPRHRQEIRRDTRNTGYNNRNAGYNNRGGYTSGRHETRQVTVIRRSSVRI